MGDENDLDFLTRRAAEELTLADASRDANVAHIHREMAIAYVEQIADLGGTMPRSIDEDNAMPQPSTSMR